LHSTTLGSARHKSPDCGKWGDRCKSKKGKELATSAEKTGAPVSALIRKAIGEYLKKK